MISDNILNEIKSGICKLYSAHLSEIERFTETMVSINYPRSKVFSNLIKAKISEFEKYCPNTEYIQQLEKKLKETDKNDLAQKRNLTRKIEQEIYSGYVSHCIMVCSDLPQLFNEHFIHPLNENLELKTIIDVNIFTYLLSVQVQMNYLDIYSKAMVALPFAQRVSENVILPLLPPKHETNAKSVKPGSQTLLFQASRIVGASVNKLAGWLPQQIKNKGIDLLAGYIPETVQSLGISNLDAIFLATDEFSRKSLLLSEKIIDIHRCNLGIYDDLANLQTLNESTESIEVAFAKETASLVNNLGKVWYEGLNENLTRNLLESAGNLLKEGVALSREGNVNKLGNALKDESLRFLQNNAPIVSTILTTSINIFDNPIFADGMQDPELLPIKYTQVLIELAKEMANILNSNPAPFNEHDTNKILCPLQSAINQWQEINKLQTNEDQDLEKLNQLLLKAKNDKAKMIIQKKIEEKKNAQMSFRKDLAEKKSEIDEIHNLCRTGFWLAAFNTDTKDNYSSELIKIIAEVSNNTINMTFYPKNIINGLMESINSNSNKDNFVNYANYMYGIYQIKKTLNNISIFNELMKSYKDFIDLYNEELSNDKLAESNRAMVLEEIEPNIKTTLFLSSSGGGGHLAAMQAKIQEGLDEAELNPGDYEPIKIDLMRDWLGIVGIMAVSEWNEAQKRGDVKKQQELVDQQPLGNVIFSPVIYNKTYELLKNNININQIINTQAMCNRAVCQAVLDINRIYNRNIKVRLIMTDLPTKEATHFWSGLQSLTSEERSVLILETMAPDISEDHYSFASHILIKNKSKLSHQDSQYQFFFDKHCTPGLNVKIANPPVRNEFKKGNHRTREQINQDGYLNFSYDNDIEKEVFKNLQCDIDFEKGKIKLYIDENSVVSSIMLGSQGGQAIVDYVEAMIKNTHENERKKILCVYCGGGKNGTPSDLFIKVNQLINEKKAKSVFPDNLIILPLGIQNATCISENNVRNDLTIMRTGGLASFEALVIAEENNKCVVLLHSEGVGNTINDDELLKSIPVWEGGNAKYLQKSINAKIVNPIIFDSHYDEINNMIANGNQRSMYPSP